MKLIVYWPDRLRADHTEVFRNVTGLRVHSPAHGFTVTQGKSTKSCSTLATCEIVPLGDNEEDIGGFCGISQENSA